MSQDVSYSPSYESNSTASVEIIDAVLSEREAAARLRKAIRAQHWQNARERNEAWQRDVTERMQSLAAGQPLQSRNDSGARDILAVQAMCHALETGGNVLGALACQEHGDEIHRLSERAGVWEQQLRNGTIDPALRQEASIAAARLSDMHHRLHNRLALAEGQVAHRLLTQTLNGLGYNVELRNNGLRAVHGRTGVWAKVDHASGELQLDLSGFSGLECHGELQRIEREIARKGLRLCRTRGTMHGRPEGGVLARSLQADGERSCSVGRTSNTDSHARISKAKSLLHHSIQGMKERA